MTTIACDGEMIAGDGLITGNGMAHEFDFEKVWRLSSGVVVGYTGSAYQKAPLNDFLEGTSDKLDLDELRGDTTTPLRVMRVYGPQGRPLPPANALRYRIRRRDSLGRDACRENRARGRPYCLSARHRHWRRNFLLSAR